MPKPLALFLFLWCGFILLGSYQMPSPSVPPSSAKLLSFVDANVKATHAHQALQARKLPPEPDGRYWDAGGASEEEG
jgi:hypothetical protein